MWCLHQPPLQKTPLLLSTRLHRHQQHPLADVKLAAVFRIVLVEILNEKGPLDVLLDYFGSRRLFEKHVQDIVALIDTEDAVASSQVAGFSDPRIRVPVDTFVLRHVLFEQPGDTDRQEY